MLRPLGVFVLVGGLIVQQHVGGLQVPQVTAGIDSSFMIPLVQSLFPDRDLEIVELKEGNTNYCFKVVSGESKEPLLFLKHAKETTRRGGAELSVSRMKIEFLGMSTYSNVAPSGVVPKIRAYDSVNNVLAIDYIGEEYKTLQLLLECGEVDVDVPRVVGTIMGRSHARSHEMLVPIEKIARYKSEFANPEALELWRKHLFAPTLDLLTSGVPSSALGLVSEDPSKQANLKTAVSRLQDIYLDKKEVLVHADLHAENILVNTDDELPIDQRCKVVDFERCMFGPAGLDLGMFLASYLVYYVAHSNLAVRRTLRDGILSVFESYQLSFRVQAKSMASATPPRGDVEMGLAQVFCDAVGFMAIYPFFLLVSKPEINFLSLEQVPGYRWGDVQGREQFVRQRHLNALQNSLLFFHEQSTKGKAINSQCIIDGVMNILLEDDAALLSHQTEFWF